MKLTRVALTLLSVLTLSTSFAQTADEIVAKHIKAIGGKEVFSKIKSQVTEANMSVMGTDLKTTTTLLAGKGFKSSSDFNGQSIVMVVTPQGGWMINPLAGATDPTALPEEQVKAAQSVLEVGGALNDYQTKGSKVELVGKDKIENVEVFKLKLVTKDGKEFFFFIDPATWYIKRMETTDNAMGQSITTTNTYSDYKKTDVGLVIPYMTVINQQFEITTTVTKVEFNKEIDAKIFEMPK